VTEEDGEGDGERGKFSGWRKEEKRTNCLYSEKVTLVLSFSSFS
jgi:hypothetical protein